MTRQDTAGWIVAALVGAGFVNPTSGEDKPDLIAWEVNTWSQREPFDAARFGFKMRSADARIHGVRWAEPRKIRQVVVEWADDAELPPPENVHLQYWHRTWDGKPDPVRAEAGAGRVGWAAMDDWTNGKFKTAQYDLKIEGRRWTYTFKPTGPKEFPKLEGQGVGYRKTLKIRLIADRSLPDPKVLHAYTDAVMQPARVRVSFGKPLEKGVQLQGDERGSAEVFNGAIVDMSSTGDLSQLGPGGMVFSISPEELGKVLPPALTGWELPRQARGGLDLNVMMAVDPVDPQRYDRTVLTVRSDQRPFSFAVDEVARGERILIDDLGVLVTRGDDDITIEEYREKLKEFPGRTVYDRVFDEPEQTLARAWNDMPLKRPLYFVHGLPGNRNAMRQEANGEIDVTASRRWFKVPVSEKDTKRKLWAGWSLRVGFGFPKDTREAKRELMDGYLPLLRSWWQVGPIHYEQCTIMDALDADLSEIALDDPTVLLARVRVVNTSADATGTASLRIGSWPAGGRDKIELKGNRVIATTWARGKNNKLPGPDAKGDRQFRFLLSGTEQGKLVPEDDGLRWTLELAPGESHELLAVIPAITLTTDEEIDPLARRDFTADSKRICDYWRDLTDRATQIDTPEPWINDFYKAHLRHLLVNCLKEVDSDRLHAHVGTFSYGVFPDESAMMISDLDRRGYHDEARRNLDSFLHYQGTVKMPGNFKTTEGLFYGDGGHDSGGYNKSHGWVMWNMADHWWMTRDREWMAAAAPKLVKSCEWVIRERQATMRQNPDGTRVLEYGWLPSGSLEDVKDYWYWMVTNVCTVWGFEALADALADFGHPEAARLQKEAKAFRDDFLRSMHEARIRAPVVRLRDGTHVPKYPSRLYERGRCHGWLRETLEGSIHMLITETLDPSSIEGRWILQDFEDNLYISNEYGYAIPVFDRFWFSRGGFSMQANLLHGPLPYLYRDEIKHYVRAYFNGLASAFYPETRMCNEHSLPELGYPRGDHFKSSDEAQSTWWLRLMFVHERGGDLYLGQAIPRYWLADGKRVGIERAASRFGPLSLRITSAAARGEIRAAVTPPDRNPPRTIYLRLRHPKGKPIKSVTLNGKPYERFDAEKEWIVLPGTVLGPQDIVARY